MKREKKEPKKKRKKALRMFKPAPRLKGERLSTADKQYFNLVKPASEG